MQDRLQVVGVIGAGNFGTTVANILSANVDRVLLFSRDPEVVRKINSDHRNKDQSLAENVVATNDPERVCAECRLVVPILPSATFREALLPFASHLKPYHIVIHGTKGFDVVDIDLQQKNPTVTRAHLKTMSEVIKEETQVVRIGVLSGPNLSTEIRKGLPTASVVASDFDEVIIMGAEVLSNPKFKIYGSHDIIGTEFAGALKNMIAIGTGVINGLSMGKNIEALFLTRGLREMIIIGQALGADAKTFFGTAGIGDLIATATSDDSRNFRFGKYLSAGKSRQEIESTSGELTEGVRTLHLMYHISRHYKLDVPIVEMLFAVVFQDLPIERAIAYLLDYPYSLDVDYLNL
ncbi:MAG: NAD(P)-dependent glycerol-3-phosphate dehydrogenase [Saprospiraceae bacterium]|nr:NAD(P)-dependent glycerol-3-phosphate dehydrogenase [Saprospiraceae bacterium]